MLHHNNGYIGLVCRGSLLNGFVFSTAGVRQNGSILRLPTHTSGHFILEPPPSLPPPSAGGQFMVFVVENPPDQALTPSTLDSCSYRFKMYLIAEDMPLHMVKTVFKYSL